MRTYPVPMFGYLPTTPSPLGTRSRVTQVTFDDSHAAVRQEVANLASKGVMRAGDDSLHFGFVAGEIIITVNAQH